MTNQLRLQFGPALRDPATCPHRGREYRRDAASGHRDYTWCTDCDQHVCNDCDNTIAPGGKLYFVCEVCFNLESEIPF